jgi:hypothetical protein
LTPDRTGNFWIMVEFEKHLEFPSFAEQHRNFRGGSDLDTRLT